MIAVFIAVAVILVAFGGFLAAADAALASLSRADLLELAETRKPKRSLTAIADDPGAHLNAINFLRVVSETGAAVLLTLAFSIVFGEQWWWTLLVSVLVMTAVSFVLVGSSPRSVGRNHADVVATVSAVTVRTIRVSLGFVADALVALGDAVTPGRRGTQLASEEQLLSLVDEATENKVLEQDDAELIHSVFEFGDTVVREVMIPRADMVTMEHGVTTQQALDRFFATGVSRIPVVGDDPDDVQGVLYLRDVAREVHENAKPRPISDLVRSALLVPDSKKADDALRFLQEKKTHLALVVDEYGSIAGLVTLEDLIEELVGDIVDEYDQGPAEVTKLRDGVYRVSARLNTSDLGELFGIDLEDEDVDTVGGLLAKTLGRIPTPGSEAVVSGISLRAERAEGRRRLLRTVIAQEAPPSEDAAK